MTVTLAPPRLPLAGEVMSGPPLSVGPDAPVWAAWDLMTRHGVRHLLVMQAGRCVGVLDDRRVFAQWPLGPGRLRRKPVALLMRTPVFYVRTDSEIGDVARIMLRECVDAVPVVDDDGATVGILTCSDVLAAVALSRTTAPLAPDPARGAALRST
ncbi:MAG: hypothetical protein QOC82_3338 [Frankiaceae bacterium]|nr:hypothetical protein [Frankiaceae bacterium]